MGPGYRLAGAGAHLGGTGMKGPSIPLPWHEAEGWNGPLARRIEALQAMWEPEPLRASRRLRWRAALRRRGQSVLLR